MRPPLPEFLFRSTHPASPPPSVAWPSNFFDKLILALSRLIQDSHKEWEFASRPGFLQKIRSAPKIIFFAVLLMTVSMKTTLAEQLWIAMILFGLAAGSHLPVGAIVKKALGTAFIFGVVIPLPMLTHLELSGGLLLSGRIFNSVTIAFILLHSTAFPRLLEGLSELKIPSGLVLILSLTRSWALEFSRTTQDMALAKKCRTIGFAPAQRVRLWLAERLAELFIRTQRRSEDVWQAVQSRSLREPFVFNSRISISQFFEWRSLSLWALMVVFLII